MSERLFNFSAGPAVLPESVLRSAQTALWNFADSGIGIMEHSHRGPEFVRVLEETTANVRELAGVGDDYDVLFLQGGASSQFFMVPMNWLGEGQTADYLNTGTWSQKAMKEAKRYGKVHVASSSEAENFTYIPSEVKASDAPVYTHYTSNNTIFGTQYQAMPSSSAPLLCDASSDIFSRPIDTKAHAMVYAGAQKNLGPSGVTLVIARKDFVAKGKSDLPTMLQYRTHADNDSCYNTPPTFGIFVMGEVLKWVKSEGGLKAMHERNEHKAKLLYDFLDDSAMFSGTARPDSRSRMNVTFRATSEDLDKAFIKAADAQGLPGLKGHRSVGGMRASIYNAFPVEGVEKLVACLKDFEAKN